MGSDTSATQAQRCPTALASPCLAPPLRTALRCSAQRDQRRPSTSAQREQAHRGRRAAGKAAGLDPAFSSPHSHSCGAEPGCGRSERLVLIRSWKGTHRSRGCQGRERKGNLAMGFQEIGKLWSSAHITRVMESIARRRMVCA